MGRWFWGPWLLFAVTILAACQLPATAQGDPEATLRAVSASDPKSQNRAAELAGTAGAADAAAAVLKSRPGNETRLYAAYVYANSSTDPAPLRPLLTDPDPSVRVIAATGLVVDGDAAGFDVLVEALGHADPMGTSRTPLPIWVVASYTLATETGVSTNGPAFDATPAEVAAAQARWKTWLAANRSRLQFDSHTRAWRTGQ